jgi:hypothetical protein
MGGDEIIALVWAAAGLLILIVVIAATRTRQHGRSFGAGASGATYELLSEDKRRAIELIVEERAEARDPESADGNLPDLEGRQPKTEKKDPELP